MAINVIMRWWGIKTNLLPWLFTIVCNGENHRGCVTICPITQVDTDSNSFSVVKTDQTVVGPLFFLAQLIAGYRLNMSSYLPIYWWINWCPQSRQWFRGHRSAARFLYIQALNNLSNILIIKLRII